MNRLSSNACAAVALTLWGLIVAVSVAQERVRPSHETNIRSDLCVGRNTPCRLGPCMG